MLRRYFGKISSLGINQLVGHNGELVIDEATDKIYIMDGVTPGGYEIANIQHYGSKIFFDNGSTIGPLNDGDNSISVAATSDNDFVEINYDNSQIVRANVDAVSIVTDSLNIRNEWKFDTSGNTTFPGGFQIDPYTFTDQTLIFPGSISNVSTKGIYLTTGEITNTIYIPGTNFEEATGTGSNTDPVGISGKNGVNISAGADGQGHNQHNWVFGTEGKLTLPAGQTYEYFDVPLTGAGDELAQVSFGLVTNGVQTQWIAASADPAGSGYVIGDTFEFDEQFLGIPGANLTIEITSVEPGGAVENLSFSQSPLYPADIYRDSPVILQVGDNDRWVFGINGTLTVPAFEDQQLFIQGSEIGGVSGSSVAISAAANNDVVINTYNPDLHNWRFDYQGTMSFPGGAIINNNANTLAFNAQQGTGQLIQITAGSGDPDEGNGGELRLYAGNPGDQGVWGNVDILGGKTQIRNDLNIWTFDTDGKLHYPNMLQWDNSLPAPEPLGGYFASSRFGSDSEIGTVIENDIAGLGTLRWLFGTDAMLELPTSEMQGFAAGIKFSDGSIQTKAYTDFGSNSLVAGDSAQYVVNLDNDGTLHLSGTVEGEYESAIVAPNLQLDGSIVEKIGSSYINIFGNTVVQGGNLALSGLFDESYLWLVNTDNAIYTHSDTGIGGHARTEYRNMGGYLEDQKGHRFYTGGTWDQQQLRFAIADDGILVPGDMYLTGQIRDISGRNLLNPLNLNIDAGNSSTLYDTTDLIIDGGNS